MIGAMTKGLLYAVAAYIVLMIEGATTIHVVPMIIVLLCVRWLIKNRHNLTTEDTER